MAKAILITERIRKRSAGEAKAEEIIRRFRDGHVFIADEKPTRGLKFERQRYVKNIKEI